MIWLLFRTQYRVVSSAVERFVYTEDVGGSKPSPPTKTGISQIFIQNMDVDLCS